MTQNQKQVYLLCIEACNEFIGGWENTRLDSAEGSEDWEMANKMLSQPHETLVEWILDDVRRSREWQRLEHLHFVTIAWTRERIDKRLTKWGY